MDMHDRFFLMMTYIYIYFFGVGPIVHAGAMESPSASNGLGGGGTTGGGLGKEGSMIDAVETLPLPETHATEVFQKLVETESPPPVPSPGLTLDQRRAQYQGAPKDHVPTLPAPGAAKMDEPSEPAPEELTSKELLELD